MKTPTKQRRPRKGTILFSRICHMHNNWNYNCFFGLIKTSFIVKSKLKSIRFHLRPPIAPEACLCKSLSLNKIFVARGMWGDSQWLTKLQLPCTCCDITIMHTCALSAFLMVFGMPILCLWDIQLSLDW